MSEEKDYDVGADVQKYTIRFITNTRVMNIFLVVAGTYQEFKNYARQSQFGAHARYVAPPPPTW